MKFFITGGAGFVAPHLCRAIFKSTSDSSIISADWRPHGREFKEEEIQGRFQTVQFDLNNFEDIRKTFETSEIDIVIHLASFSSIADSWKHPIECLRNNCTSFLNLLEAIRLRSGKMRILQIGSSDQYGKVDLSDIPIKETLPMNPRSPYGVFRVAQEHLARIYFEGYGLEIINTRSFNHCGPGQDSQYVLAGLARQFARIRLGKQEPVVELADPTITRDFTDVRDVVRAYLLLAERGVPGQVYNVCSGVGRTLFECIGLLKDVSGLKCEINSSKGANRPTDNPVIIGDNSKLKSELDWSPDFPLSVTLRDMIHYFEATEVA